MIIGVAGTIGAGKETLTSYFRERGFVYLETSAIIKENLIKEGKEVTRTAMQDWADDKRRKYGVGAIMQVMLEIANMNPEKHFMFDSLRNDGEAEFLRANAKDFVLIAVDAPREIRFKRMMARNKAHDPKTWEEFLIVDERDHCDKENPMGQQTRKLIEMADYVIVNDDALEKARKQVESIHNEIFAEKISL